MRAISGSNEYETGKAVQIGPHRRIGNGIGGNVELTTSMFVVRIPGASVLKSVKISHIVIRTGAKVITELGLCATEVHRQSTYWLARFIDSRRDRGETDG